MKLIYTVVFFMISPCLLFAETFPNLEITEYFVRNVPKTFTLTAGYFKLKNKSEKILNIKKVTSNCAEIIELHDVIEKNGVTKMVHMPKVQVAPGAVLYFQPRGKHIMLINLTEDYHNEVPCKFDFKTEDNMEFSFTARRKKR